MSGAIAKRIKKLLKEGFVHIFSTSVLNKILALLTNVVVVRLLTKEAYGNFSYAYNIITTIMVFSSIGIDNALLQYGCEISDPAKRRSVEKTLFAIGLVTNCVASVATLLYAAYIPLTMPSGKIILMALSFLPLFQYLFKAGTIELRILRWNKQYALATNIQTVAYFVFACVGAYVFSTTGTALGRYCGYFAPLPFLAFVLRNHLAEYRNVPFEKQFGEYLKYAFWVIMANATSSVLYHLDVYLVGLVTSSANSIAEYKVATQIPTALSFIPTAVVTFIYPKFVEHSQDAVWLRRNLRNTQLALGAFNLCIAVGGVALAPWIIRLVFGPGYDASVLIFRMLLGSYCISGTFRIIYGTVLAMIHQVKANFWMGIAECVVNIIADVVLIKHYGSMGAAFATITVVVFSSVLSGIYLHLYLKKLKRTNTKGD